VPDFGFVTNLDRYFSAQVRLGRSVDKLTEGRLGHGASAATNGYDKRSMSRMLEIGV